MSEHPNIPELEGTFPVVLYFGSQADADEFIAIVKEAKPGLVARSLPAIVPPLGIPGGKDVTAQMRPELERIAQEQSKQPKAHVRLWPRAR